MDHIPPFDSAHLESLCRVIADTTDGLTGREIARILTECKIPDITPEMTKWKRLFNALAEIQRQTNMGNHAIMVLTRAMSPVLFTASPGLFAARREKLNADGAELITQAFAFGKTPLGTARPPILAINALVTETDRGEQRGFVNLLIGLFGTIRNPAAHNPKVEWPMSEQDALDILTMASLIHRKLDKAANASS